MDGRKLIIAIDGPSGAGKSTAAKSLAEKLGYVYLETGGLYRAVGWAVLQEGIDPEDVAALGNLCRRVKISVRTQNSQSRFWVGEKDVTDELRTAALDRVASFVSRAAPVREALFHLQRQVGSRGGVVVEGRDIGSVVFPDADLKFFLDASLDCRARRRFQEMHRKGQKASLESVLEEIQHRDQRDSERELAPLKKADDAVYLDTSDLTLDQVVDKMMGEFRKRAKV